MLSGNPFQLAKPVKPAAEVSGWIIEGDLQPETHYEFLPLSKKSRRNCPVKRRHWPFGSIEFARFPALKETADSCGLIPVDNPTRPHT